VYLLRGRPGRAQVRRIVLLLATTVLAMLVVVPGLPGGTEAGGAFPVGGTVRLEGPRRVVVHDLPAAAAAAPGQTRELVLSRRHLSQGVQGPDVAAPAANAQDQSFSQLPASPPAPSSAGFEGLDNSNNAAEAGVVVTPPDPQVAVGPRHVFEMVNIIGRIYTRTGGTVQTFRLASFFGVPAGYQDTDPKVLYDALSGRWFASYASLIDLPGSTNDQGRLHLAISQTNDPTGAWNVYVLTYSQVFPDYPGMGITSDKITISSNIFDIDGPPGPVSPGCSPISGYCGEHSVVFEKADLLSAAPTPSVCGPSPNLGFCSFPFNAGRFTVRPAQLLSSANDQYLTTRNAATTLKVIRITGTPDGGNVTEASATNLTMLVQNAPPASATLGGTIDSGDNRLLDATWRNGQLWTSASAACVPAGDSTTRSCAHVIEVDTGTTPPTISQDIVFGAQGEYFSWPALRTDASGDLYVSLTHTDASIFAEARATGRLAGDPPNTMSGSTILRTGDVLHTSGRWGDYLGAAVDPIWPECVWLVGEYAKNTPFSSTWDWGTFIAATSYSAGCDGDNDGWSDGAETTIGTNPALACGLDANPADFNSDQSFTGFDLSAVAADIGKAVPPAPARKDIAPEPPDGFITGDDLSTVAGLIGRTCMP